MTTTPPSPWSSPLSSPIKSSTPTAARRWECQGKVKWWRIRGANWANTGEQIQVTIYQLFTRLEEGRWSEGRPVFKKVDGHQPWFLLIKEGEFFWSIRSSTITTEIGIHGGKGTNSPNSPQAGGSDWLGLTGWLFVNDRDKWTEGDITVRCHERLY